MVNKSTSDESKGLLIVLVIVSLLLTIVLPITAIMYIDMLAVRSMVSEELTKVVRERKALQRERLEKESKRIHQNEVSAFANAACWMRGPVSVLLPGP